MMNRLALVSALAAVPSLAWAGLPLPAEMPYFLDEFDGCWADNWTARTGAGSIGANIPSALASSVSDGLLTVGTITGELVSDRSDTDGRPFTCGGFVSKEGLGYGYYEISAKLPLESGWHCSFWTAEAGNEIDAFEIDTGATQPRHAQFNTHYWGAAGVAKVNHVGWGLDYTSSEEGGRSRSVDVDTSTGYHRYGFEWTPTRIDFYIDGILKATTRYPGPHDDDNKTYISMLAYNKGGSGVDAPAVMSIDYFEYYRRNYGFANWNAATFNPALPDGDSTFSVSQRAMDPDQDLSSELEPHVIVSTDFSATASWDFPADSTAASGRYEVFVWNPSMFSASAFSADISAAPEDAFNNPGGMQVDYTISGQTTTIDAVYGGQSWRGLGPHAIAGATASVLEMEASSASPPNPLWPLRAGPAVFRPLERFDDFASGSLGAEWDAALGSWSASSGQVANSGAGQCLLLRQSADVTIGDGLVRSTVFVPGSGGATSVGLVARSGAGGHYLLRVNLTTDKLGILRYDGSSYTVLADVKLPDGFSTDVEHELVFVLDNSGLGNVDLLGFVDGQPVAAVTDTSPGASFTGSGQVGLRTFGGAAQFDNFGAGL